MSIDERLVALIERHEALNQSVELLAHMFRDNETRNQQSFAELRELQKKNEILAAQMMESITSLARIAQLHDRRISNLEQ